MTLMEYAWMLTGEKKAAYFIWHDPAFYALVSLQKKWDEEALTIAHLELVMTISISEYKKYIVIPFNLSPDLVTVTFWYQKAKRLPDGKMSNRKFLGTTLNYDLSRMEPKVAELLSSNQVSFYEEADGSYIHREVWDHEVDKMFDQNHVLSIIGWASIWLTGAQCYDRAGYMSQNPNKKKGYESYLVSKTILVIIHIVNRLV
jgi:hypothetical protein